MDAEPKNQNSHYYKGYILEDIPDYQLAIEAYENSLQIDPAQNWVNFRLGVCYQLKNRYQDAVNAFTKSLLNFFPFSDPLVGFDLAKEQILTNRAISFANLGLSQQCLEDCSKAIEANENYSNSYFIRGLEFLKLNKNAEAEQDLKKAVSLNHPKAYAVLQEYFPKKQEVFEQIRNYADSLINKQFNLNFAFPKLENNMPVNKVTGICEFDFKKYLDIYINTNKLNDKRKDIEAFIENKSKTLNADNRFNMNGHDFINVLFNYINKIKNTPNFKIETFEKAIYLSIQPNYFDEYDLFKNL